MTVVGRNNGRTQQTSVSVQVFLKLSTIFPLKVCLHIKFLAHATYYHRY